MTIKLSNESKAAESGIVEALKTDDSDKVSEAFDKFAQLVCDDCAREYEDAIASNDDRALEQRGFRVLTSKETEYYTKVIDALKSSQPKQAFADIPDTAMPTTIITDVLKNLTENHALLAAVNPTYVGYITRWIRNKHSRQTAAWGAIDAAIEKEITSAFEVVEVKQGKLSAFACIAIGMLDLGPTFLDGYVRTVLGEAWSCGLEYGIVSGIGINEEPIGLIKNISSGVSIDTSTGYPDKTPVAVTGFDPTTFGALVAELAADENGKQKNIDLINGGVALIVNNNDYLTRIMPATRVMGLDGLYRDSFPVATTIIISNAVSDGQAILALLDEYELLIGGDRGIQYSDEFKFLDDQRYFKIVSYAYGQATDNTSAVLLDITGLEAATIPVVVNGTVTTEAAA